MPVLILLGIIVVALFILYSFIEFVSFSVNYVADIGWATDSWFTSDNGWAWFIMFVALAITFPLLRLAFGLVRWLLMVIGGFLGSILTFGKDAGAVAGVYIVYFLTFVTAVCLAFAVVTAVFNYTSANPGLTTYFVEGNWFAGLYLFLVAFGLLFTTPSKD